MKKIVTFAALLLSCLALHAQTAGSLDLTFDPLQVLNYNGAHSLALQSDGKILVGGSFSGSLARLNTDGTIDPTFNPGKFNSYLPTIVLQPNGKILVGGGFTTYNALPIPRFLARLNSDGTLDNTFNIGTEGFKVSHVRKIVLQPNGKIIVGGNFEELNGLSQRRIARMNADGSLDPSFQIGKGFNGEISTIALQEDGKIIIGGLFRSYNDTAVNCLIRLNPNGSIDPTFLINGGGFNAHVEEAVIQSDGKIVVAGGFTVVNNVASYNGITRLNSNGTTDTSFHPGSGCESITYVRAVTVQPDGKILLGGQFTKYDGNPAIRLVRLNKDGSFDPSFVSGQGCDQAVREFTLQPDKKILVVGEFKNYNGTPRQFIARLNGGESIQTSVDSDAEFCADQTVKVSFLTSGTFNNSNIFTAELSNSSGNFNAPIEIGSISGISGSIITASIPKNTPPGNAYRIRVVSSNPILIGEDNGNDIKINKITPAQITISNNILGTTEIYVSYQWLADGGGISGATNSTYIVTKNGNYSVVVTDSNGCKDTSDIYKVTSINEGVNIKDTHELSSQIKIYPNPVQHTIQILAPQVVHVRITDIMGKKIKDVLNAKAISVNELAAGIYLFKISDQNGQLIKVEKMIKIKN